MFLVCLCRDFLLISCCCYGIVVSVNQLCYTFCSGFVDKKNFSALALSNCIERSYVFDLI